MSEDRYEGLWNESLGPTIQPDKDEYVELVLEQYREYVATAEATSERRLKNNAFFLTLNTALIAGVSYVFVDANSLIARLVAVGGVLAAILLALVWRRLLRSYRAINSAKFDVVGQLEQKLPASPFWNAEWALLERPGSGYTSLARLEGYIPMIILAVQCFMLVIGVLSIFSPGVRSTEPLPRQEISLSPFSVEILGGLPAGRDRESVRTPDRLTSDVEAWLADVVRESRRGGDGARSQLRGSAIELAAKILDQVVPAVAHSTETTLALAERLLDLALDTAGEVDPNRLIDLAETMLRVGSSPPQLEPLRVLFDSGSDVLPVSGHALLRDLAEEYAGPLLLIGSTDRVGAVSANQRLAERRVLAVRAALLRLGYQPEAISLVYREESAAPIPTPDDVSEPENRSVTIERKNQRLPAEPVLQAPKR